MIWLSIAVMSIITFFNRYAFFARQISYQPSARLKQFLTYSSFAVLTAIWVPIVFSINGNGAVTHAGLDYLIGAALAAILSIARAPVIVTVIVSSGVFFSLRFLVFVI